MKKDKQLGGIRLAEVRKKRSEDQALTAKEFAVMAGLSYSTARNWFRLPGFPSIRGYVFWSDFISWRRAHAGLSPANTDAQLDAPSQGTHVWPARAAKILKEM